MRSLPSRHFATAKGGAYVYQRQESAGWWLTYARSVR